MEILQDVPPERLFVIPAYAGIQKLYKRIVKDLVISPQNWIPAFAGMTGCARRESDRNLGKRHNSTGMQGD
ncbi:MAG: hypothetical protein ACOYXY_15310 [Thermodesulfobacteriota bacterium]